MNKTHTKQYRWYLPGACITPLALALLFLPAIVTAQSDAQLDRLIFEPVYIDPQTSQEIAELPFPMQLVPLNPVVPQVDPVEAINIRPLEISQNIDQYQEAVDNTVSEEGPFSADLYETLLDLGTQHQMLGDHEEALEVFERAEYVSRINNGLYHPQQFASVEKMIESYMAMGDIESANQKQRYLVYLSEQHFGLTNMETLPFLINLANRNMDNFDTLVTMRAMPTVSINSGGGGFGRSSGAPTPQQMAFTSLFMAQQNYLRAISTMINNKAFFEPTLLDLEYNYLETLLLQSFRRQIMEDPDYYFSGKTRITGSLIQHGSNRRYSSSYVLGKNAFERILIYLANNPQAKVYQLINALMEYGDWFVMFGRSNTAVNKYREALGVLEKLEVEQSTIDQFFRPAIPVHLPMITAKPNSREKFDISRDAELEYEGYFDIAFTISRFGKAKRFDVLAQSENANRDIERRLVRYLRNSPFRPRMQRDGSFDAERVTLRYYYTFAEPVI